VKIASLAYRTDLIFPAFDGQILDRGDYLAVRTPSNPSFYWGNFLLFSHPPLDGDFEKWRLLFVKEIGEPPETHHQAFGWDAPDGADGVIQPFLEAGFHLERSVVLTTVDPRPPLHPAPSISIRQLTSDLDFREAVELQVLCREPEFGPAGYRVFRERAMERYRNMISAGLGAWYGAFVDAKLVADLGIFHDASLIRYQSVETHPDFRRRGIAGALVLQAGREAIAAYGRHALVIVAEEDAAAARLYSSLGFQFTERARGLLWWSEPETTPGP
jgi:ribosomal protein S18 acetylase RimI-like enzyme